jgi:hypothetical protein
VKASIIVTASKDTAALEETLFSLACDDYRPLEVVVVGSATIERWRKLAGDVEWRVVDKAPLAATLGRFVGYCEAGQILYPHHLAKLIALLCESTSGWAVARARWAVVEKADDGMVYTRTKREAGLLPGLGRWTVAQLPPCAALFDRERVEPPAPSRAALLRLALRIPPIGMDGLATCEVRVARLPAHLRVKAAAKARAPLLIRALKTVSGRG